MPTIWIDGTWHDRDSGKISVFDHGLLYGDGVFEGIRVYAGKVFKLPEHLDRLWESAHAVLMEIPMPKAELGRVIEEAVRRSGLEEAYIRPIVTRGVGDLGIDPRKCARPTVIVIVDEINIWTPERLDRGLAVITAGTPIPHREALSPRVKSLNYLSHAMAKLEANVAGADEALMLDASGHVAEGTGQNVFVVKRGVLRTPPLHAGILGGITRGVVIELAREAGHEVREEQLNRFDIYTADEAFFTGTASEIAPIRSYDGRVIGAGRAGPVTKGLMARFRAYARGEC
ncbi:MAG: branched-chain-amino-acid transaminase [Gemmatimonadetes bacterium]|nr:MAG: branched-chain-amino-acid transaminase [Gemmatimonadota bacterium]